MLELDTLIGINQAICELANEDSKVINENNLLSALSVQQWYDDDRLLASALIRSITIGHGFQDGNKRTAAIVGAIVCPYACDEDVLIDCILDVATGKLRDVYDIAGTLYNL